MSKLVKSITKSHLNRLNLQEVEPVSFICDGDHPYRHFLYKGTIRVAQFYSRREGVTNLEIETFVLNSPRNFTTDEWNSTPESEMVKEFQWRLDGIDLDRLAEVLEAVYQQVNHLNESATLDEGHWQEAVSYANNNLARLEESLKWVRENYNMWDVTTDHVASTKAAVRNLEISMNRVRDLIKHPENHTLFERRNFAESRGERHIRLCWLTEKRVRSYVQDSLPA